MAVGGVSPKIGKVVDIPTNAPTIGTATDLQQTDKVSVAFTAPSTTIGGPVFLYSVLSTPGSLSATGTASPITVTGLTTDTAYTFQVRAGNPTGYGPYSSASNTATPTILPTDFVSLQTITLTSSASSIEFTSISGSYQHLFLHAYVRKTGGTFGQMRLRFNGNTGSSSYTNFFLYGTTSGISIGTNSGGGALESWIPGGIDVGTTQDSTTFAQSRIEMLDYTSTNKKKSVRVQSGVHNGTGNAYAYYGIGSYLTVSSAITSIQLSPENNSFAASSTFALYALASA